MLFSWTNGTGEAVNIINLAPCLSNLIDDRYVEYKIILSHDSKKIRLACGCQATMPHAAVRIDNPGFRDDFWNWKVDIMSIAYTHCDTTISSKCTVNLSKRSMYING